MTPEELIALLRAEAAVWRGVVGGCPTTVFDGTQLAVRLEQAAAAIAEAAWQPIETFPSDCEDVILRPHRIWGAMDVRRLTPSDAERVSTLAAGIPWAWVNGDLTTAWTDTSFLPFWMPRPPQPSSRACNKPAPDRSGRRCDKPTGHDGIMATPEKHAEKLQAIADWFRDCKTLTLEQLPVGLIAALEAGAAALTEAREFKQWHNKRVNFYETALAEAREKLAAYERAPSDPYVIACLAGDRAELQRQLTEARADHSACHDLVCSGSRQHPRGDKRHSCSCSGRDTAYAELTEARAERDRLREALNWLVHLAHDIGKAGGRPESDEWDAAWEQGKAALSGDGHEQENP